MANDAYNSGSAVSVGTSSGVLLAARGGRSRLILSNMHATATVDVILGTGTAVVGTGLRLYPTGPPVIIEGYSGALTAIASGAATGVGIVEL